MNNSKYILYLLFLLLFLTGIAEARYIDFERTLKEFAKHEKIIKETAAKYQLDYVLVTTIIAYESNFRKDIISKTNDVGLMQIHTHKDFDKLKNPQTNINVGCSILRKCFNKYKDLEKSLTAYNRGIYGARKLKTSKYAKDIIKNYKILKSILEPRWN